MDNTDTDQLLKRVAMGESSAAVTLLSRHRPRLRRMVSLRIDKRLAARLDPSDVVQDVVAEAHRRLQQYANERPIAFYPWLRRIAWDRLLQMHRQHIEAACRSVLREDPLPLTEESEMQLADQLAAGSAAPEQLLRSEIRQRVRHALGQMRSVDREVIALRHLEDLSFKEVAAVLDMNLAAVHSQYYRAIKKLHRLLQGS